MKLKRRRALEVVSYTSNLFIFWFLNDQQVIHRYLFVLECVKDRFFINLVSLLSRIVGGMLEMRPFLFGTTNCELFNAESLPKLIAFMLGFFFMFSLDSSSCVHN